MLSGLCRCTSFVFAATSKQQNRRINDLHSFHRSSSNKFAPLQSSLLNHSTLTWSFHSNGAASSIKKRRGTAAFSYSDSHRYFDQKNEPWMMKLAVVLRLLNDNLWSIFLILFLFPTIVILWSHVFGFIWLSFHRFLTYQSLPNFSLSLTNFTMTCVSMGLSRILNTAFDAFITSLVSGKSKQNRSFSISSNDSLHESSDKSAFQGTMVYSECASDDMEKLKESSFTLANDLENLKFMVAGMDKRLQKLKHLELLKYNPGVFSNMLSTIFFLLVVTFIVFLLGFIYFVLFS